MPNERLTDEEIQNATLQDWLHYSSLARPPRGVWPEIGPAGRPSLYDKLFFDRTPAAAGETTPPCVILSLGRGLYRIGDSATAALGENSHEDLVLQFFLRQPAATGPVLARKSGVPNAVRILKKLRTKYPEFGPAIHVPGKRGGGGYSVAIKRQ